ncbi:MAG: hypothetical protein NTV72_02520 [Candidatus Taylorbacteria bacterium]|nr:hypothetical protein [Candidatus Taylorbacteria bacterium]
MRLLIIRSIILVLLLASVVGALLFSGKLRNRAIFSMEYTKLDSHLVPLAGAYLGVKSSKKYYFPWCYGAERSKAINREVFASLREAEGKGYIKSKQCSGL